MRSRKLKYVPHPKQVRFHRADSRFKLFLAGIGTGKTLAGVHECLAQIQKNPGYDGMISAPTYPMLRDAILPLWFEFIPKALYTYYKKDAIIEMVSGEKIFLRSFERPDNIRGLNLAWAWADELAMVRSREGWLITQARVGRVKSIPNPCIFATTTPRGWNWLAKEFLKKEDPSYRTIRARSSDNPYFSPYLLEQLRSDYGEEFARQELDAEILDTSGLCWPLMENIHLNWSHQMIKDLGGLKYVAAGVDWGFSAPASIVVAGRTRDGTWFVLDEYYERGQHIEKLIDVMRDMRNRWKVKVFHADSAEPEKVAKCLTAGLSVNAVKKGDGSVSRGVQEVRSLINVYARLGRPKMYVDPVRCKNLVKEADAYHYLDGDSEKAIGEEGDHACDALRYLIHSEFNKTEVRGVVNV